MGGHTKEQCGPPTVGGVFSWILHRVCLCLCIYIAWYLVERVCVDPAPVPVPALIEKRGG